MDKQLDSSGGDPERFDIPGAGFTEKVLPANVPPPAPPAAKPPDHSLKLRKMLSRQPESPHVASSLYDPEKRVEMYERMKHRMFMQKLLRNGFEVLVLFGLLFSLWYLYKVFDSHLTHKRELAAQELTAELAAEEAREKARLEELAQENARREAERQAAEKERRLAEEERQRQNRLRSETKDTYNLFLYALRENEFDIFGGNVTNSLLDAGGELCYLLPADDASLPLYWVTCCAGSAPLAFKIESSGERQEVDFDTFQRRIAALDYLVAKDGVTYYHPHRKKPTWGSLGKTKPSAPSDAFFGGLSGVLKVLKPSYDDLMFDIVFVSKSPARTIICETLDFGCEYSLENVRAAIDEAFPSKGYKGGDLKLKKYKRTVKFWNGSYIKQGIDGITYVPRTQPSQSLSGASWTSLAGYRTIYRRRAATENSRANWSALYQKVLQEDAAEERYYETQRKQHQAMMDKGKSEAENAHSAKIEKILSGGELYYHAKKRRRD